MRAERIGVPDEREAEQLAEIEQECFSHPMTAAQIRSLAGNETVSYYVLRDGEKILGFVWLQTVLDEGYIGNVAVRRSARRQGIADCLLQELEQPELCFLTLEVREGNLPAIALYEKHGYQRVGCRRGYYTDPKEDAVLMTKRLREYP